jgi:hypothetical protein
MGEARRPPGGAIIGQAGAPLPATLDRRGPAARRCCGWRLRLGDLEAADAPSAHVGSAGCFRQLYAQPTGDLRACVGVRLLNTKSRKVLRGTDEPRRPPPERGYAARSILRATMLAAMRAGLRRSRARPVVRSPRWRALAAACLSQPVVRLIHR